jgi:4'-phosphopantetheinyl transferase EntD
MHTTHTTLTFADHTLHIVEFDPDTFQEHDLFWLPHHTQLQSCGRKRKAEHLAGRIAAVHALREYGIKTVPASAGSDNRCGHKSCLAASATVRQLRWRWYRRIPSDWI